MANPFWYCPNCQEEVDGSRVTFQERQDVCGNAVECIEDKTCETVIKSLRDRVSDLEAALGGIQNDICKMHNNRMKGE